MRKDGFFQLGQKRVILGGNRLHFNKTLNFVEKKPCFSVIINFYIFSAVLENQKTSQFLEKIEKRRFLKVRSYIG